MFFHSCRKKFQSLTELDRDGIGRDFLKAGDMVESCVFRLRGESSSSTSDDVKLAQGEMLIMPNGSMQIWGAYGKLRGCVRPDDRNQAWVEFIDSNRLARTHWCRQFSNAPRPVAVRDDARTLIEEIDRLMADSC